MKKYLLCGVLCALLIGVAGAKNTSKQTKEDGKDTGAYVFTDKVLVPVTPVKDQAKSGTCWSFSGTAMAESELLRRGKGVYDLSEMWIVRHTYLEKAIKYARLHGKANFSEGGTLDDVVYIVDRYGIVPETVYSGLKDGASRHSHEELSVALKAYTDAVIGNPSKRLSASWIDGLNGILDAYLGPCPEKFVHDGKEYTPKSFAQELGIRRDDYVVFTAMTHHPLYTAFPLEIPDNWNWSPFYNVTMEELGRIVDVSLRKGYAVNWASDVSENGFGFREGRAIVPVESAAEIPAADSARWKGLTDDEIRKRTLLKTGVLPERQITPEMRQQAFDRYETTDDHGMLLVGIAADQHGRKFYKVKNSWGETGLYKGYFYASEPFLLYKTVGIQVHREAIPQDIKDKLGIR
ncbi:aminopeptidase C [Alistipes sp. cv1]|uniref:aminopeptidase C n=1 Tax=Alistipes sp. cv1 TaxID=1622071 RepID=UPI000C77FE69|nr:C1 family peptidase [Alistipes sp. cv1]